MQQIRKHAYWIHKKEEDPHSVSGYIWLRECTCSNCGYESNMEKEICPECHAVMDASEPKAE